MIAFTNNMDVAAPGVYVLGYIPKFEIDRIVGYAIANGRRTFAALLPKTPWGGAVAKEVIGGFPPGRRRGDVALRQLGA